MLARDSHRFCATDLPGFAATLFHEDEGVPIVSAFGEIDLSTARELDALLAQAIWQAGDAGGVVVDLAGVEFMDVVGLGVLIKSRTALRETSGGSLAVVCEGHVSRLFEAADLSESFDLYTGLRAAVEGCSGPERDPAAGPEAVPDVPGRGGETPAGTVEPGGFRDDRGTQERRPSI